jgi:hypothetical protein
MADTVDMVQAADLIDTLKGAGIMGPRDLLQANKIVLS